MSERKQGFYWVKDIDHPALEYWEVWFYDKHGTWSCGTDIGNPSVIGDRIPTPEEMEGWQVVPKEQTRRMAYAVEDTDLPGFCTSSRQSRHHDLGRQIYEANLQAAPKPGDV